jgi:hypothetical protein
VANACCVRDCDEVASIHQPLKLGDELVLYVPLCQPHSAHWVAFAARMTMARDRAAKEGRDAGWLLDAALALALFPPADPL